MSTSDINAGVISYFNISVTFNTEFGCGCEILVFIDGWDRQPGILWINFAPFYAMTNIAWDISPSGYGDQWGGRFNFEFAGCTTRWHVVHRGDIVDWRVTTRTRAVHSHIVQYISMRVRTCLPKGLYWVCGHFCLTDGYLGSPSGAPLV